MKPFDAIVIGTGPASTSLAAARDRVFFTMRTDTKVQLFSREASDLIAQLQMPTSQIARGNEVMTKPAEALLPAPHGEAVAGPLSVEQ